MRAARGDWYRHMYANCVHYGDALEVLKTLPPGIVQCCVTSPPYWGLRDYSVAGQFGLEATPDEYIARMVGVFREVKRVLRDDGTVFLNLGDSYANTGCNSLQVGEFTGERIRAGKKGIMDSRPRSIPYGLKPKDLCMIPARVALALQADGWWLRSDIIWCLSGGTRVYARTQKGEMPMTIKDMVRLDPSTVQLWNGERWTQVLGWNRVPRPERTYEIELRSGERIGCTAGHLWPTQRGTVRADDLMLGDIIQTAILPEPLIPLSPKHIDSEVAWFLGLYLAEGSRDGKGRIQIAGHAEQNTHRTDRLRPLAESFGGTVRAYIDGNNGSVIVDCPPLAAIIDQYIHGRNAKTKGLKVRTWHSSNEWLAAFLNGYLEGDGHHDSINTRWRLGFTRNDRWANDLRTICARLGYTLTLKATTGTGFGKRWPIYRGELRKIRKEHHNEQSRSEVVRIQRSRARKFWDIGVADWPYLFALASGVLTHNSKPNPMPESCTDRPTTAHEHLFLLSKRSRYFYDADAIREEGNPEGSHPRGRNASDIPCRNDNGREIALANPAGRNKRTVWEIPTYSYAGAHFATFPPKLVEPCILAGTSPRACEICGAPWKRVTAKGEPDEEWKASCGADSSGEYHGMAQKDYTTAGAENPSEVKARILEGMRKRETTGWQPTCPCDNEGKERCLVLDPFAGSGTTGEVALKHGRGYLLIELNRDYEELIRRRLGLFYNS